MACIRDRGHKPQTDPQEDDGGIERVAGEAAVPNKYEEPVPCCR